ncbi:MAG: LCCL domain-containing protein [Pseudomonadota bacterium]
MLPIWGVDVYTDDSAVCVAAVHAGAISPRGGVVTVTRGQGQQRYPGGQRNGVVSYEYGPWPQSFRVTGSAAPPVANNPRIPVTK